MKYSIQLNAVNSEKSKTKAFATVTFANSFKICDIAVIEVKEGNPFVAMPCYKSNERTAQNEPVYKDYCNPITKEFREELYGEILDLYNSMKEYKDNNISSPIPEEITLNKEDISVKVTLMDAEENNLCAMAGICFADSFVVNNIKIIKGKESEFVAMPSKKTGKTDENGKAVYRDICYPVTKEFREELYQMILDCYQLELAEANPFTKENKE